MQIMQAALEEVFGRRLRLARKQAGLSQERLAEKLDVSPTTVVNWEKGHNSPEFGRLQPIADLLGKTPAWFLQEDDDGAENGSSTARRRPKTSGTTLEKRMSALEAMVERQTAAVEALARSQASGMEALARSQAASVEALAERYTVAMEGLAAAVQGLTATQRAGPNDILAAEVRKLTEEVQMLAAQEFEDVEDDCPDSEEDAG